MGHAHDCALACCFCASAWYLADHLPDLAGHAHQCPPSPVAHTAQNITTKVLHWHAKNLRATSVVGSCMLLLAPAQQLADQELNLFAAAFYPQQLQPVLSPVYCTHNICAASVLSMSSARFSWPPRCKFGTQSLCRDLNAHRN